MPDLDEKSVKIKLAVGKIASGSTFRFVVKLQNLKGSILQTARSVV